MYPIETINYLLALGTLAMQVMGLGFLVVYFLQKKFPDLADVGSIIEKWGMWKAFALTLAGSALTLFYSEILGFAPCGLCWLQRVFLYPQIILFGMALWKLRTSDVRERKFVADLSIVLSLVGGIVALYQHYLQMGGEAVLPCPATGPSLDCASRFLFEFGYITFPLMSATLFAFLIVLMLFVRRPFVKV